MIQLCSLSSVLHFCSRCPVFSQSYGGLGGSTSGQTPPATDGFSAPGEVISCPDSWATRRLSHLFTTALVCGFFSFLITISNCFHQIPIVSALFLACSYPGLCSILPRGVDAFCLCFRSWFILISQFQFCLAGPRVLIPSPLLFG